MNTAPNPSVRDLDNKLEIHVPPDKSMSHRALIFAGCAEGKSILRNVLIAEDIESTKQCLKTLGVFFKVLKRNEALASEDLEISSPGLGKLNRGTFHINFGNSGTTARLLSGLFSGLEPSQFIAMGDASLSRRPMARVVDPLRKLGAKIRYESKTETLPITILGSSLTPQDFEISVASAQIKSALMLASLNMQEGSMSITLPAGSRDHTEKFFEFFGNKLEIKTSKDQEILSWNIPLIVKPFSMTIPGDPSSAAFLAPLSKAIDKPMVFKNLLLNSKRTYYFEVLEKLGFKVETKINDQLESCETSGDVTIVYEKARNDQPLVVRKSEVPKLIDEIPVLAAICTGLDQRAEFQELEELKHKESNRLDKTCELLRHFGGQAHVKNNKLVVEGLSRKEYSEKQFFECGNDHRIIMAGTVLGLLLDLPFQTRENEYVAISFPNFFHIIDAITK